ncbi:hypothetical protein BDF19DRAFT_447790, partial [Syncephalis fuscata]
LIRLSFVRFFLMVWLSFVRFFLLIWLRFVFLWLTGFFIRQHTSFIFILGLLVIVVAV